MSKTHEDDKVAAVARGLYADIRGVEPACLRDAPALAGLLKEAALAAGLTALGEPVFHRFEDAGQGVTAFLLLAESHISLHTYPEHGLLLLDVLTCGDGDPDGVLELLSSRLGGRVSAQRWDRGRIA